MQYHFNVLPVFLFASLLSFQNLFSSENTILEADIESCKQVVESYCQAWKNTDYNAMYSYLSSNGMGKMEKEKFISTYENYSLKGCKLTSFEIQTNSTNVDFINVKTQLTFEKEIKPNMISGVHSFYLEKDKDLWMIKTIIVPFTLGNDDNYSTGSHPGE